MYKVVIKRTGINCSPCPPRIGQEVISLACTKGRFSLDIRNIFLTIRIDKPWNRLQKEVVLAAFSETPVRDGLGMLNAASAEGDRLDDLEFLSSSTFLLL